MTSEIGIPLALAVVGVTPFALTIGAWSCICISGWALFLGWMNRAMMTRFYGPYRYQACHAVTWLLGMQAARIRSLAFFKWLCAIVGMYGLVRHIESSPAPFRTIGDSIGYAVLLLIGCVQFFGQGRPASVLLLGACHTTTLRFHARLRKTVWPHRVVSLLETKDALEHNINSGDCFRITMGQWEPAISRFIRCSIIVIVDHRIMTPAVSYELHEIARQGVQFKTVLIGDPPASGFPSELASCHQVSNEEDCCALLKSVLSDRMVLPSDVQPIGSFAAPG